PGIAQQLVDVILAEIVAGLRRDGDVTVPNFGRFKVVKRLGRRGVDPQGKAFRSEAKTVVTFKASRALNNLVVDGYTDPAGGAGSCQDRHGWRGVGCGSQRRAAIAGRADA